MKLPGRVSNMLCPLRKETEVNNVTRDTRDYFMHCIGKECGWWKDFDECSILSLTRKNKGE